MKCGFILWHGTWALSIEHETKIFKLCRMANTISWFCTVFAQHSTSTAENDTNVNSDDWKWDLLASCSDTRGQIKTVNNCLHRINALLLHIIIKWCNLFGFCLFFFHFVRLIRVYLLLTDHKMCVFIISIFATLVLQQSCTATVDMFLQFTFLLFSIAHWYRLSALLIRILIFFISMYDNKNL